MSLDLLIENSERQEVSKFKDSIVRYIKKWPLILLCVLLSITSAFVYLKFKPNLYQIQSKVLIKKNSQFSDPNELLFGGRGGFSRFSRINDESIIFGSYPLVRSALDSLKFDVSYKINDGFKEIEIYKESPIVLNFDRELTSILPTATTFSIKLINNDEFELITDEAFEGKKIKGSFRFGERIKLGSFEFTISRNSEGRVFPFVEKYMVNINSLKNLTYFYKGNLEFEEVETLSSILTMSMTTKVPQKSIDFINALIESYIEQNLIDKNAVAEKTVAFIDEQLAIISDSLNNKEQNLENFKSSENIADLSIAGAMIIEQYNQIESDRAQFEVMQQYFNYLKENLKDGSGKKMKNLVAPSAFGIQDMVVNNLVSSLVELNLTKSRLDKEGNSKNPLSEQVDLRIEEVTRTLNESIENLSNANMIILSKLKDRSDKIKANAKKLPSTERQLVNLNRLLQLNENIYLFLMEKRSSAAITKSSNTPDCRIIEPAMLNPLSPIGPNSKMAYMVAIILGIFIPITIFILKDFLNDTIRGREDVESSTNAPILGMVPNVVIKESKMVVADRPKSAAAEAFRTIRSNLSFFQGSKTPFVILITSSIAKEGKTYCALNLATILASSAKKTILLGFDLRKPQLHNYLNIPNDVGISNYISGNVDLDEIILKTSQENLFLLNSGAIPPNPAELLMEGRTKQMIQELKKRFDYIIMDTPPVGIVSDALILKDEADMNLFVVRENYSKREFLENLNDLYTSGRMKNLSILLNDVETKSNTGYGYYEEDNSSLTGKLRKKVTKA